MTTSIHRDIGLRVSQNGEWVDVDTGVGFDNSWVNFGGSEQDAEYIMAFGRVWLQGTIKTGTSGTSAFTLPVGFRPATSKGFVVVTGGTVPGRVIIATSGTVTPTNYTGSAVATSCRLDGIVFVPA